MAELTGGKLHTTWLKPRMPWFLKSRPRLLGTLSLVLIFPMGVLYFLMAVQVRGALVKEIEQENRVAARRAGWFLERRFQHLMKPVENAARLPELAASLQKKDEPKVRQFLEAVVRENSSFKRTFIADRDGIALYDYPPSPSTAGRAATAARDFSSRDWYHRISDMPSTTISGIYQEDPSARRYVLAVASPVWGEQKELLGYLAGEVPVEFLLAEMTRIQAWTSANVTLVDPTRIAVAKHGLDGQSPVFLNGHPLVRALREKQTGSMEAIHPLTGEESWIQYTALSPLGWAVLASHPVERVSRLLAGLRWTVLFLALVCFYVMFVLLGLWFNTLYRYHQTISDQAAALLRTNEALERLNRELEKEINLRKRGEEAIRKLNADLEDQTETLEIANKDLETFSYSVSHDLRAPLRSIEGFCRILQEDHNESLNPEGRRVLGVIQNNIFRMNRLIEDLLAFSRLGYRAVQKSNLDMDRLVREVVEEQKQSDPQRLVVWSISSLPAILGDPTLIRQVWANLISNAMKFTRSKSDARIEIGSYLRDGENVYTIRDNGVGFDPQYAAKLFGVFQRLHRQEEFEGNGVGLAIVQRVIQKHGGRVWAEGKLGEGACFQFTLP